MDASKQRRQANRHMIRNLGIKGSPSKERLAYEISIKASEGQDANSIAKRGSMTQSKKNLF